MYALSPAVKTVPENRSSSRAVASAPAVPQNPMSPAPTSTPLPPPVPKLRTSTARTGVGVTGVVPCEQDADNHTSRRGDSARLIVAEPIRFHALHRRTRITAESKRKADEQSESC